MSFFIAPLLSQFPFDHNVNELVYSFFRRFNRSQFRMYLRPRDGRACICGLTPEETLRLLITDEWHQPIRAFDYSTGKAIRFLRPADAYCVLLKHTVSTEMMSDFRTGKHFYLAKGTAAATGCEGAATGCEGAATGCEGAAAATGRIRKRSNKCRGKLCLKRALFNGATPIRPGTIVAGFSRAGPGRLGQIPSFLGPFLADDSHFFCIKRPLAKRLFRAKRRAAPRSRMPPICF
ncbi:MAG: hypothetical protein E6Q06_04165 [Candidatus Moraniibacteriota bacterium]|nr:MAG: hypothetical protein E6Q06_04165 [Candidatus Moranbacteria bacterium]